MTHHTLPPGAPVLDMLMPAEGTPPPLGGTPVPVPAYFRHAEPGFSLKRPRGLSRSLPPRPPAKGSIPVSRLFPPRTPGWHQPHARRVSFQDQASEPLRGMEPADVTLVFSVKMETSFSGENVSGHNISKLPLVLRPSGTEQPGRVSKPYCLE